MTTKPVMVGVAGLLRSGWAFESDMRQKGGQGQTEWAAWLGKPSDTVLRGAAPMSDYRGSG